MDSRCGKDTSGQTERQGKCSLVVEDCGGNKVIRLCGRLERKSCNGWSI